MIITLLIVIIYSNLFDGYLVYKVTFLWLPIYKNIININQEWDYINII